MTDMRAKEHEPEQMALQKIDFGYEAEANNQFQVIDIQAEFEVKEENIQSSNVGKNQTIRSERSVDKDQGDDKLYLSAPKTSQTYRKFYRSKEGVHHSQLQRNLQNHDNNRLSISPELLKNIHKIESIILQVRQNMNKIHVDENQHQQRQLIHSHNKISELAKQSLQIAKGGKDIGMQIFLHYNLSVAYLNLKNLNSTFEVSDARIVYHLQTTLRSIQSIPKKQPYSLHDDIPQMIKTAAYYLCSSKLHLVNSTVLLTLALFAVSNNFSQQSYSLAKLEESFWQSNLAIYEAVIFILYDMLQFMINNNISLKTGKEGIPHSYSRASPRKSISSHQKIIEQECHQMQINANYAHNMIKDVQLTIQNVKKMLASNCIKNRSAKSSYRYSKKLVILKRKLDQIWDFILIHTLFEPSPCNHQTKAQKNKSEDNAQATTSNMLISYMNFDQIKYIITPQTNTRPNNKNILSVLSKSLRNSVSAMIDLAKHNNIEQDKSNNNVICLNISRRCVFLCQQYFQNSTIQAYVTGIHQQMINNTELIIHESDNQSQQGSKGYQHKYQHQQTQNLKKQQSTRKNRIINMRRQFRIFNNPNLPNEFFRSITFKHEDRQGNRQKLLFRSLDDKDRKQFYGLSTPPKKRRVKMPNQEEIASSDPITKKIIAIYRQTKKRSSPTTKSVDSNKQKGQGKIKNPLNKMRKMEEYRNRHFTFQNTVADIARRQRLQSNDDINVEKTPEDAGRKLILLNHKNQRIVRIKQMGY